MSDSPLRLLIDRLDIQVPHILQCIEESAGVEREVEGLLSRTRSQWVSLDTSLVVFGSLARGEWTPHSDLDWTYLIDGQANSDHLTIAQEIKEVLEHKYVPPNPQGAFASLVFSHELIHKIGGQDDTNRNTTQRMLLLLESVAIGNRAQEAYERVVRGVINRYLEEDPRLLTKDRTRYKVPRFLLNDIVRFWRTMAVDFASKQRDRGGKGWGLRNFKLRMSRKLLFASGLLTCFGCTLDPDAHPPEDADIDERRAYLVRYLRNQFCYTPLEVLARAAILYRIPEDASVRLLSAYDGFLEMLRNEEIREGLDVLRAEDAAKDKHFEQVRRISRDFQSALDVYFFENKELSALTKRYGVF